MCECVDIIYMYILYKKGGEDSCCLLRRQKWRKRAFQRARVVSPRTKRKRIEPFIITVYYPSIIDWANLSAIYAAVVVISPPRRKAAVKTHPTDTFMPWRLTLFDHLLFTRFDSRKTDLRRTQFNRDKTVEISANKQLHRFAATYVYFESVLERKTLIRETNTTVRQKYRQLNCQCHENLFYLAHRHSLRSIVSVLFRNRCLSHYTTSDTILEISQIQMHTWIF